MNCKNCEKALEPSDKFCSECGAKVIDHRLTMRHFWAEFSERFFNIDNTFLKTYLALFKKPEDVIGGYINGVRKKYIPVVGYFTIALTLTGLQIFIIRKFFPNALDISAIMPENNPMDSSYMDWMYDYISIVTLINLPIYALISKLTFIGKSKYNYVEHLVIMTYIFSQYSITSFLFIMTAVFFGINYFILGYIFLFLLAIYTAICYKRLYPLKFKELIWRCLLFVFMTGALIILFGIIQFIFLVINGDFQEMMQTEKASRGISYIASSVINWTS